MGKLRLRFCKTGKAKYISHLDLCATMRRALARAGVQLRYSEGFNPHPYISVALPLPVGCGSLCELMDIRVLGQPKADIVPRVNATLPCGLVVCEVYESKRKFSEIKWVEIKGQLRYGSGAPEKTAEKLSKRFAEKSIVVTKKTKRDVSDFDIAPHISGIAFEGDSAIIMSAVVSAQSPSLTTDNIMAALGGQYGALAPDFAAFTRSEVFDSGMDVFK